MFNDLRVNLISGSIDLAKPARVQISMFNPYCTGKYLLAISSWVSEQGFKAIEYQVSDTLQRHNLMWRDHLTWEQSRAKSIQTGEKWLFQNSSAIQLCYQMFDSVSISRWNFWIRHNDFAQEKKFFTDLFQTDSGFMAAVDSEIESYFVKSGRTLTEERKKLSRDFLIEEIAVSEISAKYFPANEIYPGPRFGPDQYLVEADIPGIAMKELKFIHLGFAEIFDEQN